MLTKKQLIEGAFDELAMSPENWNISPAEFQLALRKLDQMMASWEGVLPLGYAMPTNPQDSDITQESGIRDEANEAVTLNLAVKLGPAFGKNVSPDTKTEARRLYSQLLRETVMPGVTPMPSSLPMGAGNKNRWGGSRFFPEPVATLEADGTALTLE